MNVKIDPADYVLVCEQWTFGAIERLDEMIDGDASVIDLRDAVMYLSGCLCGSLETVGVPLEKVNAAVAEFQKACDWHLLEKLPQHPAGVWYRNVPALQ